MKERFKEIISEAKKIALTSEEKSRVRNFLAAFMGKHKKESFGKRLWNFIALRFLFKPVYAIIFVLLLGGAGTAFAAEISLPGDILYPVKTNMVEKVRGIFTFSDEQKAAWETRRAERRMEEMRKLEEKQQLREEIKKRIEENFNRHEEKVNTIIRKMESKNNPRAAQLKERLQNSVKTHDEIIKKWSERREENKINETKQFRGNIDKSNKNNQLQNNNKPDAPAENKKPPSAKIKDQAL